MYSFRLRTLVLFTFLFTLSWASSFGQSAVIQPVTYDSGSNSYGKITKLHTSYYTTDAKDRTDNIAAACGIPANDNFTGATNIPIGTTLINQTTCGATLQANEAMDCDSGLTFNASVWYQFTATSSGPFFVTINGGVSKCTYSANVWAASSLPVYGNNCSQQSLQCQRDYNNFVFAPTDYSMELTNLTSGNVYYIQVLYTNVGGVGGCGSTTTGNTQLFSIGVTTTQPGGSTLTNPPPNNTCSTAYAACYLNEFNPTSSSVDSFCTAHLPNPSPLQQNDVYTICYSFTTNNSAANQLAVQAYLYSHCLPNVYWVNWKLYNSICTQIACGDGSDLTIGGVGCNTAYTLCFTFEAACEIDTVTPYASWPSSSPSPCTTLPISLLSFNVSYAQISNTVDINWATATEKNNKEFIIERSIDAQNWETVATQPGSGTSSKEHFYTATDEKPYPGLSYYRLKQIDYDGNSASFRVVPVNIPASYSANIFPNPTSGNITLRYATQSPDPVSVKITDLSGKVLSSYMINEVREGTNNFQVLTANLSPGMYFMQVSNPQKTFFLKFVKE